MELTGDFVQHLTACSTVSKVLRNREKYLKQEEPKPDLKPKGKFPDIEKALGSWVKNKQKAGQPITDAMIQDQLAHFTATVGGPDGQANPTSSWLEKFKVKNGLLGSKSRKNSAADDSDTLESPAQQTPSSISPTSPANKRDHSPSRLSMALDEGIKEHKRVKSESPPDRTNSPISIASSSATHKPFASISSAFTDVPAPPPVSQQQHTHSSSFSLSPVRPHSPFFGVSNPFTTPDNNHQNHNHQHHLSTGLPPTSTSGAGNPYRPRSQTFPLSAATDPSPAAGYASPPASDAPHFLPSSQSSAHDSPLMPSRSKPSSLTDPLSPHYGMPVLSSVGASGAPSVAETQRALQVVLEFFNHQPQQLEPQEYVMMGKLMEKLKLHHHHSGSSSNNHNATTTGVSETGYFSAAAAFAAAVGRSVAE
jgi:Tc5 transposase DNA-binding domain